MKPGGQQYHLCPLCAYVKHGLRGGGGGGGGGGVEVWRGQPRKKENIRQQHQDSVYKGPEGMTGQGSWRLPSS